MVVPPPVSYDPANIADGDEDIIEEMKDHHDKGVIAVYMIENMYDHRSDAERAMLIPWLYKTTPAHLRVPLDTKEERNEEMRWMMYDCGIDAAVAVVKRMKKEPQDDKLDALLELPSRREAEIIMTWTVEQRTRMA